MQPVNPFIGRIQYYLNQVEENLRPRLILPELRAELNEIFLALNDADLNLPLVAVLAGWYEEFNNYLSPHRERNQMSLTEAIMRFVQLLETILADPLHPEDPYPAELFGRAPLPLLQFIVGRMRDPHSLLYSERLAALAEDMPLPPRIYQDFKDLAELEILAQRIDAQFEELRLEEEAAMPDLQAWRLRLRQVEHAQQVQLQMIENVVRARIRQAGEDIQGLRADLRDEAERMEEAIGHLQQEALQLREEIGGLNRQIEQAQGEIAAVQRGCLELERSIKQVEESLREKQSNWLSDLLRVGISIAVTWVLQQALPGSGALFSKGKFMIEKVTPLSF